MSTPTCHHVLAGGALCQATPLRDRDYCRFHLQQVGRRMKAARMRARHQPMVLNLPLLEDLHSVQIALMQLADAIAHREIEPQHARLLTTVLRLAMQNLKSRPAWEFAGDQQASVSEWKTFEQEHDLPTGLDLSLDPEVAFPPPNEQNAAGAPLNPAVGLSGNDDALRAQVRQALGDAATTPPLVTADQVELMEIYESEGEVAARKFADHMARNDRRRERHMQRARYQELARNHNIKLAAARLVEDQRKAEAASARATAGPSPLQDASPIVAQSEADARKPPQREEADPLRKAAGHGRVSRCGSGKYV